MFLNSKSVGCVLLIAVLALAIIAPVLPSSEQTYPRILGSISYILPVDESVSFFVVEGVVYNSLDVNVKVNVTANFYDAQNVSIGTSYRDTNLRILKPEQKSSFTFYFPLNSTSEVSYYELDLSYTVTDEQPVDILEFRDVTNSSDNSHLIIRGQVWNGRPIRALNVGVVCIGYDGEGRFSGLYRAFIRSIDAGALANFTIEVDSLVNVVSYDLVVYAGGYEAFSIANYVLFAILVLIFFGAVIFLKRRGW